jgi:hypothetical protein
MDLSDNAAHILIVDDDQRIRDRLAQYLFENGFRVTTANDATCARASMRGLTLRSSSRHSSDAPCRSWKCQCAASSRHGR